MKLRNVLWVTGSKGRWRAGSHLPNSLARFRDAWAMNKANQAAPNFTHWVAKADRIYTSFLESLGCDANFLSLKAFKALECGRAGLRRTASLWRRRTTDLSFRTGLGYLYLEVEAVQDR